MSEAASLFRQLDAKAEEVLKFINEPKWNRIFKRSGLMKTTFLFLIVCLCLEFSSYAQTQTNHTNKPISREERERRMAAAQASQTIRTTITAVFAGDITNGLKKLEQSGGKPEEIDCWGEPMMVRAVEMQNQTNLLAALLERGANPNAQNRTGTPVLSLAIGKLRLVNALRLIEAGADVKGKNRAGESCLTLLVQSWFSAQNDPMGWKLLQALLDKGADPFAPENAGRRGTQCAVGRSGGDAALSSFLLTNQPSLFKRTPNGNTALHLAAGWHRTNVVDFLLAEGFSIQQTNEDGLTPLQYLSISRVQGMQWISGKDPAIATAQFLLSRGAVLDVFCAAGLGRTNELADLLRAHPATANETDGAGLRPLHYATGSESSAATQLLERGADPFAVSLKAVHRASMEVIPTGTTPLDLAATQNSAELVKAFLRGAPKERITAANANGDTPLHLAARNGTEEMVRALLDSQATVNVTNHAGETPLRLAVESGSTANLEQLLKAGARPALGLTGTTLLHLAAQRGRPEMIPILLAHGLTLEVHDIDGCTPFMAAVLARQWGAFVLLQVSGADVNAVDSMGNTALHRIIISPFYQDMVSREVADASAVRQAQRQLVNDSATARQARDLLVRSGALAPLPAVPYTNSSVITWLAEHGANFNLTNLTGQTPLAYLCQQPSIEYNDLTVTNKIAALLQGGAKVDWDSLKNALPSPHALALLLPTAGKLDLLRDADGRTVLHLAVLRCGEVTLHRIHESVALLAANKDLVDAQDNFGQTPLHLAFATYRKNIGFHVKEVIQPLLANQAKRNLTDKEGRTPFHILTGEGAFFDMGAYYNGVYFGDFLNEGDWGFSVRDRTGQTPLHLWVGNPRIFEDVGCIKVLRKIIATGHYANLTNGAGVTLLQTAVNAKREQIAKMLRELGAVSTSSDGVK